MLIGFWIGKGEMLSHPSELALWLDHRYNPIQIKVRNRWVSSVRKKIALMLSVIEILRRKHCLLWQ
jgi:hypothetical protein